jgi:hypothetical protein
MIERSQEGKQSLRHKELLAEKSSWQNRARGYEDSRL